MNKVLIFILISALSTTIINATTLNINATENVKTELEEESYVIVYRMNGATHAVIINHAVDCDAIITICHAYTNITILDCGPLGQVNPPDDPDVKKVTPSETLGHFGIEEWPQ